jgi:hypothetical protein
MYLSNLCFVTIKSVLIFIKAKCFSTNLRQKKTTSTMPQSSENCIKFA